MDSIKALNLESVGKLAESAGLKRKDEGESPFSELLTQTLELANETETQSKTGTLELLSGETEDLAGLLIDSEKAKLALNLTLQIRNKAMDAYKEIMSMQI